MNDGGLVNVNWLLENYQRPDVCILDASMDATVVFPDANPSGPAEFAAAHIPGAHYFDIDKTADPTSGLPHTLPQPDAFEKTARSLGINTSDHIVVYDNSMLRSAARAWWMFRTMGHTRVSVLDGGLAAWQQAGGPIESGMVTPAPGNFTSNFRADLFRSKADMMEILKNGGATIVDARGAPRFNGEVAEPRAGLASGHIPGAANVPFTSLYTTDGHLKTAVELEQAFESVGVAVSSTIATSCGSGVTACNLALALYSLGNTSVAVYDGSWVEWGSAGDVPIETASGA